MHAAPLVTSELLPRRLLAQSLGYLAVGFLLTLIAYQGLPLPMGPFSGIPRAIIASAILLLLARHFLRREGLSLGHLGLSRSSNPVGHLLGGVACGVAVFLASALLLRLVLPFRWEFNSQVVPASIGVAFLFHLATNTCEELAWRGYAFDGLMRTVGHWPAQGIVALAAAYFHVLSGWTWQVALISTTAGSLLFALVFRRWRSVPAAVGVHLAWNWTGGLILSSPGAATSLWIPQGMSDWTASQWQLAQAVQVGVTLAVCAALLVSLQRRTRTPTRPA